MPKEVRLLSHGPGLTRSLRDPPPVAFNTLLPDAQEQSLLSAFLSANLLAGTCTRLILCFSSELSPNLGPVSSILAFHL